MDRIQVRDAGNKSKERIVFRADSNIDLGYYILFIVEKIGETSFSSKPTNVFWFPDTEIKENDVVVVYTKKGENKIKNNSSGNTSYFFYWGLPNEQFNDNLMPVLIEAQGWIGVQNDDDKKVSK